MQYFAILNNFSQLIDRQLVGVFEKNFGNKSRVYYWMHDYWDKASDPRTSDYFMVSLSFVGIGTFFLTYLLLVTLLIPIYMRKKPAFNLNRAIITYDVIMVIINTYFFFKVIAITDFGREMWNFTNPKADQSPKAYAFIDVAYLYYLSKLVDMLDTFFMAFRKKFQHITILHLWHHTSLPYAGWLYMKYNPYQPTIAIIPLINTFIHVVMYSYYALAALGPQYHKYLWWKKYITQLQLLQFIAVFVWYVNVYLRQTDMPTGYLLCNLCNAAFLFALFYHFYRTSYRNEIKAKKID